MVGSVRVARFFPKMASLPPPCRMEIAISSKNMDVGSISNAFGLDGPKRSRHNGAIFESAQPKKNKKI